MALKDGPKFRRAYHLVVSALEQGAFRGARFLPSVASIAESTGVSRFTIWRVMRKLREEGRITGQARCRNIVPDAAEKASEGLPESGDRLRRVKHRDLQSRIRRDILNARFPSGGPLPPAKLLADRYGVSPRTLRKALVELAGTGVLVHRGRHFHPSSIVPPASPGGSRIVLLGYGENPGFNIMWGYWHRECIKNLEFECRRANIGLDLVCFTHYDARLTLYDGRTGKPCALADDPSVLGYLYMVTGRSSVDEDLLQRIVASRQPVGIIDEYGLWPSPQFLRQHPSVRVFRNTLLDAPARQVARYVLELGHRTAVYVSAFHGFRYSQDRLAALQEEFTFTERGKIVAVTDAYDPGKSRQYASRINLGKMAAFYREWRKDLPQAYASLMEDHFNLLYARMQEGRQRECLDELFARALEVRDATAWIMVNDVSACYALEYLARQGVSVPHDLSIISFDDLPEAMEKGVTSYDFNYPALVQAALRSIADPRRFPARAPVVGIEGEIIPRRTTARARSRPTEAAWVEQ